MMENMISHESCNEVIAVIVAAAQVERQRNVRILAGIGQQLGLQLLFEELVAGALVNQQRIGTCAILDQSARVVFAPRGAVIAKIARQRLFPPWAVERADDRREGPHRGSTARFGSSGRNLQPLLAA